MRLTMARQTVKRLYDLEIDEISLVDRGANQHATVAIAKRDEDGSMGIYDADGYEVEETDLQHGDVVYDDSGTEYVFVEDNPEDGTSDSLDNEYEDDYEEELVGVGKAIAVPTGGFARRAAQARKVPRATMLQRSSTAAGNKAKTMRRSGESAFSRMGNDEQGRYFGGNKRTAAEAAGRRAGARGLESYAAHPGRYAAGAGGTLAVGGEEAARRSRSRGVKKSLGESVYEELSKALNSGDRDEVIAKALDTVEIYKAQAEDAWALANNLAEERDDERFIELAKSYQLPVDHEVLAEIMKSAAATMPDAHVETLDRIFSAVGEQLYNEVGASGGYSTSETMEMVNALAGQHVGKSDLSQEQAIVALFDANPSAYDDYITELKG